MSEPIWCEVRQHYCQCQDYGKRCDDTGERCDDVLEQYLTPKKRAWLEITQLPAYLDMPPAVRELQRAIFDYAWEAAMRTNP